MKQWKDKYLITAKIAGKVALHSNVSKKYRATVSESIVSIIPGDQTHNKIFAKAVAPENGIGKIRIGNKVIIRVDGYPYKEYGIIIGRVQAITRTLARDQDGLMKYEISIPLSESIQTSYNITIPYQPNLRIQAEIITDYFANI